MPTGRYPGLDAVDDELGFVSLVIGAVDLNGRTVRVLRPQLLAQPATVVGDEGVRRLENMPGGAVVLLQANRLCAGKVLGKADDVLHPRPPPGVDRLVVVAHHEQLGAITGQHPQPGVLQFVGVLEFVDQDVLKPVAVMRLNLRVVATQLMRTQQQFGEVDQIGAPAGVFIDTIDLNQRSPRPVTVVVEIAGAQPFFLARVDEPSDLLGHPLVFGQIHALDQPLDQALLIVGIQNLKVRPEAGFLGVQSQHAMGDAVEGPHPHGPRRKPHQRLDARTHLLGCLVGKGHRKNRQRRYTLHAHEPGYAVGEHAGLAATRPCQYQSVFQRGRDGLALRVVERVNNRGDIAIHGRGFYPARPPPADQSLRVVPARPCPHRTEYKSWRRSLRFCTVPDLRA